MTNTTTTTMIDQTARPRPVAEGQTTEERAQAAISCCGPAVQETCCAPADKASCCSPTNAAGTCGCQ